MAKFIHKKSVENDPSTDGRTIFFSKTPLQNTEADFQSVDEDQSLSGNNKSHKLAKSEAEQILIVNSENKDDRVFAIKDIFEEEKKELSNIQTLIKKQSKSLQRAKKGLMDKQLLLQAELDRKAYKFSNNEKFSIMGELSSRMAHDIRNPLTVIKMQVDLLKLRYSKQEDQIMLGSLGRMERAVIGINNQLEDILNFLRGDSPTQFENSNVLKILDESLLNIVKPDNITIDLPKDDFTILCDSYKMQRAFTNIIQNSIQAMEDGGTITIRIFEQDNNINIEIEDTGPGIPADLLPKIFEPLFTTKRAGTGLGLTICRKIVEDHNGSISAKNNPTTFIITLPKIPRQG